MVTKYRIGQPVKIKESGLDTIRNNNDWDDQTILSAKIAAIDADDPNDEVYMVEYEYDLALDDYEEDEDGNEIEPEMERQYESIWLSPNDIQSLTPLKLEKIKKKIKW